MKLSAKIEDDLNWKIKGFPQFFEFDLGLNAPFFPLEDELTFSSIKRALDHFRSAVYPEHPVSHVILYRGTADFSKKFLWTERQEKNFQLFKETFLLKNEAHLKRLFTVSSFVYYFQMLSHHLPEEVSVHLLLDPEGCGTLSEKLHLLSIDRFEHFEAIHPLLFESSTGVCFPPDDLMTDEILEKIEALIKSLPSFKPVSEPLLTQQWDGLDELYVFKDAMGPLCERKLLGFEAAGGKVLEIRGRGI